MRPARPAASVTLLALAYLAFVSLGLPDAVLGVAWPSVRDTFNLPQTYLGLPLALGAVAYFLSGMAAGKLMQWLGIGRLLAASTALVAIAVLGYSAAPAFLVLLLLTPVVGFGSGAIDSALNTYAARNFRPRQMTWLHAAYAAGAMSGPAVMTAVLARGQSWRAGYAVVAIVLTPLVIAFISTGKQWAKNGVTGSDARVEAPGGWGSTVAAQPSVGARTALRSGRVQLQVLTFFLYTGIEVSAGQWSYTLLTEGRDMDEAHAGTWVSIYWGGLLAGRLILGFAVERMGQVPMLRLATLGALLSALLFSLPGWSMGVVALPLLSFSLAPIYPGLMSETPRRVGEALAPHAIGFQVSAATLGVALLPSAAGLVSQRFGLESIGLFIALCALLLVAAHERLVALTKEGAERLG